MWWLLKAEGSQPGSRWGSFQLFEHTLGEGVKAKVPLGVRTGVERTVEHSRARERQGEERAKWGGHLARPYHIGLWLPVEYRSRAK